MLPNRATHHILSYAQRKHDPKRAKLKNNGVNREKIESRFYALMAPYKVISNHFTAWKIMKMASNIQCSYKYNCITFSAWRDLNVIVPWCE